jgi:hypothetical protein
MAVVAVEPPVMEGPEAMTMAATTFCGADWDKWLT